MKYFQNRYVHHRLFSSLFLICLCLTACGGIAMKKHEQGIAGTFTIYGPPNEQISCEPHVTQFQKDSCKRENQRVIEEPLQTGIIIRNLGNQTSVSQELDAQGSFRVHLKPGQYEICVKAECTDPLEVRPGKFTAYGKRFPKSQTESTKSGSSNTANSKSQGTD